MNNNIEATIKESCLPGLKRIGQVLLVLLLAVSNVCFAQLDKQAARALIARIIPDQANHFEVAYIPKDGNRDVFEIKSSDGKIVLSGNNGVSVASALNYYLQNYCHCSITWNGTNLNMPAKLPQVTKTIRVTSPYKFRYYLNYCTFNYTMSWWNWDQWQKEIDWMALNGINMPLALTGQNYIWDQVYKSLGFTDEELDKFFPGPAYFSWFWMSNLDGWGGPLPQNWMKEHEILQKKILARERSLGMIPVLPAFTGHVPPGFKDKFPEAKLNKVNWFGNFPDVNILNPDDSLFTVIGRKFLELQTKEYGTDHYYSSDVFNEITPPTSDTTYLSSISGKVYRSMQVVDPKAVWVMQGWLFLNDTKFWKQPQIRALLSAVPDENMIILDLYSEHIPVWNKTDAYYGKPWIWNMLNNFGGNIVLYGNMNKIARIPASLINDPKAGRMEGIGLTMEGAHHNPGIYQLMLSNVWSDKPINLDNWIKKYTTSRYGKLNDNAVKAWEILRNTVYKRNDLFLGGPKSIITERPVFKFDDNLGYDPKELIKAWELLIQCSDQFGNNDGFQYDLVDVARQVLANYADQLHQQIVTAYKNNDIDSFQKLSHRFLQLLEDMDRLLGTRRDFLLGTWLENARRWGTTPREKNLYEFNARDLITLWGPKDCALHDYASKQWNGMLKGFYEPRWQQFFQYVLTCMKDGKKVNMNHYDQNIENWEWNWVTGHGHYATTPQGDPVAVSKEMYRKYSALVKQQ